MQPVEIVPFGRRGADQIEAVLGEARDGELADNASALVQHVGKAEAARPRQAPTDETVEPGRGTMAFDYQLGESAEIEKAHALAHRAAFLAHGGMKIHAPETGALLA